MNKPLKEKLISNQYADFFVESDVRKAVKEAYDEISEYFLDEARCELDRIFSDKFGFSLK